MLCLHQPASTAQNLLFRLFQYRRNPRIHRHAPLQDLSALHRPARRIGTYTEAMDYYSTSAQPADTQRRKGRCAERHAGRGDIRELEEYPASDGGCGVSGCIAANGSARCVGASEGI